MFENKTTPKAVVITILLGSAALIGWFNRPRSVQPFPSIFHSITSPNPDALRAALDAHPDAVREVDLDGNTALHIAAITGNTQIIDILIAHHADPNAKNARGETPLQLARQNSKPRLLAAIH
ncbi:MAG TPA: ankyrin repeat domain-containing protein [Phycisphaerae bacterium]|nr:ankyrin repeat domain-containing protein [Phycisphaerae bacterium]